jgi:hypothetical protein
MESLLISRPSKGLNTMGFRKYFSKSTQEIPAVHDFSSRQLKFIQPNKAVFCTYFKVRSAISKKFSRGIELLCFFRESTEDFQVLPGAILHGQTGKGAGIWTESPDKIMDLRHLQVPVDTAILPEDLGSCF